MIDREFHMRVRRGAYKLERLPKIHPAWEQAYTVTGEVFEAQLADAVAMIHSLGWDMEVFAPRVKIGDLYFVLVDGWTCELKRSRWAIRPDGSSAEAQFIAGGKDVDPWKAIIKAFDAARQIAESQDFKDLYMDV